MSLEGKYTFFVRRHGSQYGLLLEGAPPSYFPVTTPLAIHDIMEHEKDDDGSLHAEMMAQGAVMLVRGEGGLIIDIPSSVGISVVSLYHDYGPEIQEPPPIDFILPSHVEEWLVSIINVAVPMVRRSLDGKIDFDTFLLRSLLWMKIGYARARERYSGWTPRALGLYFKDLLSGLNEVITFAEKPLYPGDRIHLTIKPDSSFSYRAEWDERFREPVHD